MKFVETVLPFFFIQLFAEEPPKNVTESEGLSPSKRTYYTALLRDKVEPKLVHDTFAQMEDVPQNGGKTINFRRIDVLPKMTQPLEEGKTPDGQTLTMQSFTAELKQYGGWLGMSDWLLMTAADINYVRAVEALQSQASRSLDTITREVLNGGTNVQYGEDAVSARNLLTGDNKLTVDCIERAVRKLKVQNAETCDGQYYGSIIHPDCTYDLRKDPEWRKPHEYKDTKELYSMEIGCVGGARFLETTEAKIFPAASADGKDVYSTLVLGKNAYGVTKLAGRGLEMIIKQLGEGDDPLNQRATAGWKANKTAVRLNEAYMVRIETCSTFDAGAN